VSVALTKAAEAILGTCAKLNLLVERHTELALAEGRQDGSGNLGGRLYPRRVKEELRACIAVMLPAVDLPNRCDALLRGKHRHLTLAGLDAPLVARLPTA
jgi:hypothetical protein